MQWTVYQKAGLKELKLVINSLGDTECRVAHKEALVDILNHILKIFVQIVKIRLEKNPLRILDCKVDRNNPLMATAPSLADYLNEESAAYFEEVKEYLDDSEHRL